MKLEQQLKQLSFSGLAAALLLIVVPEKAFAMHIMEGFLPPMWALAWWLLFVLFLPWTGFLVPFLGVWFIWFVCFFLLYNDFNAAYGIEEKISQQFPEQTPRYDE